MNPFARVPPAPTPSHPLLDRLWGRYIEDVPHAALFAKLHGAVPFKNDHVALRTLGSPGPGIASVARVFERLGWRHAGDYAFDDVHLRAVHLSKPGFPRIFISELEVAALPVDAQDALVTFAIDATPPPGTFDELAAWFRAPRPPPLSALEVVARASQYGAWLLAFGRKVNHFTASVSDVELWQLRLLQAGVPMKAQIEGAPGGDLRQTATQACHAEVTLADGQVVSVPYAYFEIAERKNGFDGFLAPQARHLFDLTAPAQPEVVEVDDVAPPYESQRKHARKDAVVAVEAMWADGTARLIAFTSNLSLGGVFLSSSGGPMPPKDAPVRLLVDLAGQGRFEVRGKVSWALPDRGVGVELWWDSTSDPGYGALAAFLDAHA